METDLRRWPRPSWTRAYVLALAAPAFRIMWLRQIGSPAKVVGMLMLTGWLVFIFRIWFWYEKPA